MRPTPKIRSGVPARDSTDGADPVRGAHARVDRGRGRGRAVRNAMRVGSGKAGGQVDRHAHGLAEADRACASPRARRSPCPPAVREAARPRAGTPAGISGSGQVAYRNGCGDAARGSSRVREGVRGCGARVESRARRREAMQRAGRHQRGKARDHPAGGRVARRKGAGDPVRGSGGTPEGVRGSSVGIDPAARWIRPAARPGRRSAPRAARGRCPGRRRGPGDGAGGWRGWRRSDAGWARAARPRRAAARAG